MVTGSSWSAKWNRNKWKHPSSYLPASAVRSNLADGGCHPFPFAAERNDVITLSLNQLTTFLRYPGGKRRMLAFLSDYLPNASTLEGRFIEPFVGGGAVYFYVQPKRALLTDINNELIDLYRGICERPDAVWRVYRSFPRGKRAYKQIRAATTNELSLIQRAARSLYLNRTCFKGMWRHNRQGRFNIGYGGESRRWSITRKDLFVISDLLSRASLRCIDFEPIVETATPRDYLFIDPPYRPGDREQTHDHYFAQQFTYRDHKRLAASLHRADRRGVRWLMTTSAHPDILKLYKGFLVRNIPKGTSRRIGVLVKNSGEALISNSEK